MRALWVPFPEVAERTESKIMTGWSGMPDSFDDERLQLNVNALRSGVINWGGYSALKLSAYRGDEDEHNVEASGVDQSGAGVATGVASISRAESASSRSESDDKLNAANVRNGTLGVHWNISALNSRLDGVAQQYDAGTRARQLDKVIRKESIKEVWKHNTTDLFKSRSLYSQGFDVLFDGIFTSAVIASLLAGDAPSAVRGIGFRLLILVGEKGASSLKYGWANTIHDAFSLSARPTRAAVASGVRASRMLVRAVD